MKLVVFHILFTAFFLFVTANSRADNTYPFIVSNQFQYFGGRLSAIDNNPITFFFLKQYWIANSETLVRWKGFDKTELIGINLGLDKIQDIFFDTDKFLVVGKRNNYTLLQFYNLKMEFLVSTSIDSLNEDLQLPTKIQKYLDSYIILCNSRLFKVDLVGTHINSTLLFDNIEDFQIDSKSFYLLEKHDNFVIIKEYKNINQSVHQIRLESAEINRISLFKGYIFIKSTFSEMNSTLVQIIERTHFRIIYKNVFDVNSNLIEFMTEWNKPLIYLAQNNKNQIVLTKLTINNNSADFDKIDLEEGIYEPMIIRYIKNNLYLITRNALIRLDSELKVNLLYYAQFGTNLKVEPSLEIINNYLVLASNNYSEILELSENKLWFLYHFYHNLLRFIIPIILIIIAYIYFKLYHKQKKIFTELLNLPSANIFIILNTRGNVEYLSAKARELLMIDSAVNINVSLQTLLRNPVFEPILNFYENSIKNPGYYSQKLTIINKNEAREYIFSISPYFAVSGTLNGYLINAIDITEQLERKKMANWAQLAHDMQTNLLTIKLNAEQMDYQQMTENKDRLNRILHQVNLLQKRVRDIVTIGRSTNLELVQTNTYELMSEAAAEFDKSLFPNVEIFVICDKLDLICDKPKILRAIRNCIENGIKAMPDSRGRIDLNAWYEGKMVCLSIKDSGKGMDDQTKKKFLVPYFSTSKDGSGFGIGTIIIQQAVELHNGKIEIKSKSGTGTEIILKLPRIKKY